MSARILPFSPALARAVWRGDSLASAERPGVPTGFPALDAVIPGGGWPVGALTEIIAPRQGIGELALAVPALARLSAAGRWLALIAPPHLPYAPALAAAGVQLSRLLVVRAGEPREALWALRQTVASRACALAVGWLGSAGASSLRRLQLAADGGGAVLLLRPAAAAQQASPAALRLLLETQEDALAVRVIKRRGAHLAEPVLLPRPGPRLLPENHVVARPVSAEPAPAGVPARHA